MIQADNISFSYGKKQVLKNISLELALGKLYAVIGPNGSGKTTLLHTLAKLHKATGTLLLNGERYETIERRRFAKHLALLPQERSVPDMTVRELVSAGRYPHLDLFGKPGDADRELVRYAMRVTDTERFAEQNIKRLSGGERQRAYIAMLAAQDTPYVLLDEPTSHLDISCCFEILELLRRMKENGKCVVTVLHDLSLALNYADEVILLSEGTIVSVDTPMNLIKSGFLEEIFHITVHPIEIFGKTELIIGGKKP